MGVTVTFVALLELMREGLIEVVQAEPYSPLHARLTARQPEALPADGGQADAAS
jgi:segregation and condensation protein A